MQMDSKPLGGRYQVVRQLGFGGFSRTFLVQDLHLPNHPKCVVKQLKLQSKDTEALDMARRLFHTEAQVLYRLGSHSQIPKLLAHFEENEEFYLAQEFIEGVRLTHEFAKDKPWPEAKVILLLREIFEILVFVHQQQVIHRDIKPSNLIRRYWDGKLVLIDFGAVKQVSTSTIVDTSTGMTNLTVAVGTQGYMPNEQYAGKPRFSSDVYAVGMIGIRALTGVHPKNIGEDPVTSELDWHHHAPEVSPALRDALDQMVRYDFRDRYPTALEALQAVQQISIGQSEEAVRSHFFLNSPPQPTESVSASRNLSLEPISLASQQSTTETTQEEDPLPTSLMPLHLTDAGSPDYPATLANAATQIFGTAPKRPWVRYAGMGGAIAALGLVVGLARSEQVFFLAAAEATPFFPRVSQSLVEMSELPQALLTFLPPREQANLHVQMGEQFKLVGQFAKALAAYDEAISIEEDYAPAYLGRCETLNALQRFNEAVVACSDALAYQGYNPEAVQGMAYAVEQQGKLQEALTLYERTNRLKPALAEAWLGKGRVLQKLGRSAEAITALEESIVRDRTSAEAWNLMGEANFRLERYSEAVVAFDKALQLQPDHPTAPQSRQLAQEKANR